MGELERLYVKSSSNYKYKYFLSTKIIEHVMCSVSKEVYEEFDNNDVYDKILKFIQLVNYSDNCFEYLKYKDIFDIADNFLDISMKILYGKQEDLFIEKDIFFSKALNDILAKKECRKRLNKASKIIKSLIYKTKNKEINHITTVDGVSRVERFSFQEFYDNSTIETPSTINSGADEHENLYISGRDLSVQPSLSLVGNRVALAGYKWIEQDIDAESSRYFQECEDFHSAARECLIKVRTINFLSRVIPFIYSGKISNSEFIGIYKHKDIKFIIHLSGPNDAGSIFLESDLESIN